MTETKVCHIALDLPEDGNMAATDTPIWRIISTALCPDVLPMASLRAAMAHCSGTMRRVNKSLAAMLDVWYDDGLKCIYL